MTKDEISDSDPLYQAALAVEQDEAMAAKMAEWEAEMLGEGITAAGSVGGLTTAAGLPIS